MAHPMIKECFLVRLSTFIHSYIHTLLQVLRLFVSLPPFVRKASVPLLVALVPLPLQGAVSEDLGRSG